MGRMVRPGSSFPVADPVPATLAGRDDKQRGRMEGTKGSSLVGETTTVAAVVITITTTGNTTMATTMVNTTMATTTVNMEMVNTTMVNTTMATTTMVSAVDSQMEVDASVTTDSPSETSMGTHMEPVEGRTTRGGPGATPLGGATPAVEICKPRNGFLATRGRIGPVGIMDKINLLLCVDK